jgi:hypothetical protein
MLLLVTARVCNLAHSEPANCEDTPGGWLHGGCMLAVMPQQHLAILVVVAIASMTAHTATAQAIPQMKTTLDLPGIQPLNAGTLEKALAAGEHSGDAINDPMSMRSADCTKKTRDRSITVTDAALCADLMTDSPFAFFIQSPYTLATALASNAKRKFASRPQVTLDDLNGRQVVVHVGVADFVAKDVIENVVVKRGVGVLQPLKATVTPVEIRNGLGASRTVAEGDFTFTFAAFDPSSGITLVLVGKLGNVEWKITSEELLRMK